MKYIQKRNGEIVLFDYEKINNAMRKAFNACGMNDETVQDFESIILHPLKPKILDRLRPISDSGRTITVEDVQDIVEETLMQEGHYSIAKKYILYREKHKNIRTGDTRIMEKLREVISSSSLESNLKRDNANIDGNSAMGTMLQIGASASKEFYASEMMDERHAAAHKNGDIHIHDMDFYGLTTTCCQIDVLKLFHGGFSTGHGYLREPQSIMSYAALAAIAIQSNQNDQHGGQSIPNFDYAMAEGVRKTFHRNLAKRLTEAAEMMTLDICHKQNDSCSTVRIDGVWGKQILADIEQALYPINLENARCSEVESRMAEALQEKAREQLCGQLENHQQIDIDSLMKSYDNIIRMKVKFAVEKALQETEKETYQAMESFIHNLNTMHSRAGAQVPFSSINYGTDTSPEGRLAMRQLLLATDAGLGQGETPIFPIQILKVKEGINYNPGDPNYDIFKLACRVSAKRLFPNFVFLDSPFNLQYYKPGHPETEVATMGCRTRVMANPAHPDSEIAYGRGNLSFTSINLPRIAIEAKGDVTLFYSKLHDMLELVKDQLLDRFQIQATRHVYNYPFLMGQGVWIDSKKLHPNDEVREVLTHGSLSIGFIGLAETLIALYGHHHGENDEMEQKGLEIIWYMRNYCDEQCQKTGLNFGLLATPAEGLSGRFTRLDREKYGVIPGVNDRAYYTNSFHIPVWYNISIASKIAKEAPFHELTNAGHITYVELDGDVAKNLEAFEAVVRCMHDNHIGYGSINHPVDRDPVCGYVGIIGDTCPRCGRREGEALSPKQLFELRKKYPNAPVFNQE